MKTSLRARFKNCFPPKTLLTLLAGLVLAGGMPPVARAVNIGPDDFGYVAKNVPYAFEDISGSGTSVLAGADDATALVPIGFGFSFYGVNYTSLSVTPNGLITFGGQNSEFSNRNLNTTAPFGDFPSVAVLWDDWYAGPGSVFYRTQGTPGTRRLIVQWQNVTPCCSGNPADTLTFQVVLYEAAGVLKFQYADTTTLPSQSLGSGATVGIRDKSGQANGRALQWSVDSAVITSGLAIQFRPGRRIGPDTYGYTASDTTASAFEDISGSGTPVLAGSDDGTASVPIGFNFNFYGTGYSAAGLTPNGLVTFGGLNGSYANDDLRTAAPFGNLPSVAVMWDDWYAVPGSLYYQTLGSAPNRRFIAQWHNVTPCCTGNPAHAVTYQVIFYEASQSLKVQFADVDAGTEDYASFGVSATVGIRDTSGHLNGRNLQWSLNQPVLCNDQSILFSPWGLGRVAVFGAPGVAAWNDDVQSKVAARMNNIPVDKFLVKSGDPVPTLAQLLCYRSVLVYSDQPFNDATALGNVLADYVDAGGGVVVATFSFNNGGDPLLGRLKTGGYLPFTTDGQTSGTPLTLIPDLAAHPLLNGVAAFNGGSGSYHNRFITPTAGSELVAHWGDGQPLVGAKGISLGRVVGLNFFPPSHDADPGFGFWDASTDGGLLMANALKFAGARTRVVSVFDDGAFVDTIGGSGAESDTLQASLTRLNFTVTTFTDIIAATATNRILLFPEQEISALAPTLNVPAKNALSSFVSRGGLMIVHGSFVSSATASLLNTVFGFSAVESSQTFSGPVHPLNGAAAAGTAFADDPATIPFSNGSSTLLASSLPAGSKHIYQNSGQDLVTIIPFGTGKIIFLGYDWFDGAPLGSTDGGWLQVLASAVTEADALRPSTLTTINAANTGWYDVSGGHSSGNPNYAVGDAGGPNIVRNFFVFNIPALTGTPLSAELRVNAYTGSSDSTAENYELRAVSTPIATLIAGGSGLTGIYNDLGDGTVYGGRSVGVSESGFISIPLNAAFLAALPSGGAIAVGGQLTTMAPGGPVELLFGFSQGNPGDVQLVLSQAPTHLANVLLQVTLLSPTSIQLTWPVTPDQWQLQSSPTLINPVWTLVPDAPAIVGNQKVVILPATGGGLFFRLVCAP